MSKTALCLWLIKLICLSIVVIVALPRFLLSTIKECPITTNAQSISQICKRDYSRVGTYDRSLTVSIYMWVYHMLCICTSNEAIAYLVNQVDAWLLECFDPEGFIGKGVSDAIEKYQSEITEAELEEKEVKHKDNVGFNPTLHNMPKNLRFNDYLDASKLVAIADNMRHLKYIKIKEVCENE